MSDTIEDIIDLESENVGGIQETEIYYILRKDLDTLSEPVDFDSASTVAEMATISAAHVPASGKGFKKITAIPETGEVASAMEGELDARVFKNSFNFSIKGNKDQVLGVQRQLKDKDMIVLVREFNGQLRQIGSKRHGARFETATGTLGGGARNGRRHNAFSIYDYAPYPSPVYSNEIPADGA